MIKKLSVIFFIFVFIIMFLLKNVLAYEDNLFKFDLPSTYKNFNYNDQLFTFFNASKDEGVMIYVYARKEVGLTKSIWDIDESDVKLITNMVGITNTISVDRKAKLGKEKALKYIVKGEEGEYIEMYILASDKNIYIISFIGKSLSDLNNSDYKMIKNSFELKDRTTNWNVVYVLIVIAIIVIRVLIKNRKIGYSSRNESINYGRVDYKNMTEEDFNKLNDMDNK